MRSARILTVAVLLLAVARCSSPSPHGAPSSPPQEEPDAGAPRGTADRQAAAEKALALLPEIATHMPSDPPVNFANATLGPSFPMKMIPFDRLSAYKASDDPRGIVEGSETQFYHTVLVDGQVESSIVLQLEHGEWKPVEFADERRAKVVHSVYQELVARGTADGVALVEIPGMGVDFLSNEKGPALFVTPLQNVPDTTLIEGTTVSASDAFSQLQKVASEP